MRQIIPLILAAACSVCAQDLVVNPGFEDGGDAPTGWYLRDTGARSDDAHSGKYALSLKGKPGEKWNVANSQLFTLKPGVVYTLSFWAKVEGGGVMQGGLREVDADEKTITYTWQKTRNNAGWAEYTLLVKTKANAAAGQAFEALPSWVKPTPADLENYIYQSLIHGAVGIFYYSVNDPGWSLIKSDLWEKTKQMNGEMNTLAPVLLSDAMRHATWNVKSNPDVDAVIAVVGAETYALAVNVTEKDASAAIPLPAGAKGAVSSLFGRGKPVLKDGKIVDTIEPLGTRAYVVK